MSHYPHCRLAPLRLPLSTHPQEPHSPYHNNLLTFPQELTPIDYTPYNSPRHRLSSNIRRHIWRRIYCIVAIEVTPLVYCRGSTQSHHLLSSCRSHLRLSGSPQDPAPRCPFALVTLALFAYRT
ncbi:hypothetical protein BGY98DRAFT_168047 [Russula aff. rugulosa BPL654]|nr:hypothetical protein BGY98DRAFT_168047 [Russula aff. rugulosa BPL654]